MKLKIYYHITLFACLSIFQQAYSESLNLPKSKLDSIRLDFKKISPIITKIGQSKIPNPFGKDIDSINQTINNRDLTDKDINSIVSKLKKIKFALLEMDPTMKVYIQTSPGQVNERSLEDFLETSYRKFTSDLKLIVSSNPKIINAINNNDLKLIRDSFKPIFWGFYDLYAHSYYKYLETVRMMLHLDLNKEKLGLIRDIMELMLLDLNDENQNQTMTLETSAYQKFNLNIRDFKELIKKFINNIKALI